MPLLVGREAEWTRIEDAVTRAARAPARLLLLGQEGIGKTTLLDAAARLAEERGFAVVRSAGSDRRLPELVRTVSAQPRVALIVDDVHAAGHDALLALGADRRPHGPQFLLMAATGPLAPEPLDRTTPELAVPPLSDAEAAQLIDSRPDAPVGWFRGYILRFSGGNPLGIVELAKAAAGPSHDPGRQPHLVLPERLRVFADPIRRLPGRTRHAMLYAATATDSERLHVVLAAAGADLDDFRAAEEAGLITIAGDRLTFRHPITPIACYLDAPPEQRVRAHRALADQPAADPFRRVWHRSYAQQTPDEEAAALAEAAADVAARDCRFLDAAAGFQQAAILSPDRRRAAGRAAKAASMAGLHGHLDWGRQLWEHVAELSDDPDLVGMALASGDFADPLCPPADATVERVGRVLDAGLRDRGVALTLAHAIAAGLVFNPHPGLRAALARVIVTAERLTARHTLGFDPAPGMASTAMLATARAVLDPAGWWRSAGRGLLEPSDGPVEEVRLLSLGVQAWLGDDPVGAGTWLRRALMRLRDRNAAGARPFAYVLLIDALIDTGAWPEAAAVHVAALEVAALGRLDVLRQSVTAQNVSLLVAQGDLAAADAALARLLAETADTGNPTVAALVHRAAAQVAAAGGGDDVATEHYLAIVRGPATSAWPYRVVAELAAAAAKAGRTDEVVEILDRMGRQSDPSPRQERLFGLAAALLGAEDDTDAERHLMAAVGEAAAELPYEKAVAQLQYADWLRARRRNRDARPHLSAAYEIFQRLGAAGYAATARARLRATGVARDETGSDAFAGLTAQQQRIARLAAGGLTNREIAVRLALSPRTVGSHLYQIYPKMGISGRHQLAHVIANGVRAG